MNGSPLAGNDQTHPIYQDQDMAAFLDSMLLLTPVELPENDTPKANENEKTTDIRENHEGKIGSTPTRRCLFDELCLVFGLINDDNDPSKYHDEVMIEVFEKVRSSEALCKEFHMLLYTFATLGNLPGGLPSQIPPPMMEMIRIPMENFGVRFAEHDGKGDPRKVDLATLAMFFPGDMFAVLRGLRIPTCFQQLLPPDERPQIPPELTFLGVGALLCVLLKKSDKMKLQQVVKYVCDILCKQVDRTAENGEESIRLSVVKTQNYCTPAMEFIIKAVVSERELVDTLSRVNIPGQSAVSSKKRAKGKKKTKGRS